MKKNYSLIKILSPFTLGILLICTFGFTSTIKAQHQAHHVSVLNTTHVDFSWHYQITPTTYKDIEYFIVEGTGGAIKVAYNACDVCYSNHLGYSQVGNKMHCNNCGNEYLIDALGAGSGTGCWPGYIAHSVVGDSIIINHSDLKLKDYFFLTKNGTGIEDVNSNSNYNLIKTQNELVLTMNTNANREINVFNIAGKQVYSTSNSSSEIRINTNQFSSGVYIVSVKENGKVKNQKIFID